MTRKTILLSLCAAFAANASVAAAQPDGGKLIWDLVDLRDILSYTLRKPDGSGDQPAYIVCPETGKIEIWLGARLDKVEKPGEPVTITLRSDRRSAAINGVSELYPRTGSMRAFVKTDIKDPLFDVLASGKPVDVERPATTPMTFPAANPADVKFFLDACRTRTEH